MLRKKKQKLDQNILSEEVKKFRLLSEYSFYTGDDTDKLILGTVDEADEEIDDAASDAASDAGSDAEGANIDAEAGEVADDLGVEDPSGGEETEETGDIGDIDMSVDTEPEMAPETAPAEDEVEVDVTELVKGNEEAKESADIASQNTSALLAKFNDLENKVASMSNITQKIDSLEQELVKRAPTPVEKLEMRSLNSYPYSLKLTDYWADKEGAYDVMNTEPKKEEYVLTKDDVDSTYSDIAIKQSFSGEKNNLYEEEDI